MALEWADMKQSLALLGFALVVSAHGQDLLDTLYVTASRTEQLLADVPYSANLIDSEFIDDNERRTLPKALLYTPGVLVQQTTFGHGSPFIRGFTGRQNLLLVDGVRINNSTYRGGPIQYWNTVDVHAIDHMELVKSQGSVLYGSDAVGGTLNAFTKSSNFRDHERGSAFSTGRFLYEHRINGQGSHIGRIETQAGVGEEYGFHLGISLKDYGDISSDAMGRMTGTGYTEEDLDFRFDWALGPESTLTFAAQYVNQDDVNRWHSTLNNPGWVDGNHVVSPGTFAKRVYDQERFMSYLRWQGSNPVADAFIDRWSATLSLQQTADSEFQDRNNPPSTSQIRFGHVDVQTYGLDLTLETDTAQGTWIYGFDYYRDEVDARGYRSDALGGSFDPTRMPLADDSTYDLLGAFGQYIWRPNEQWEITSGARYTYARADLGNGINESPNWDALVGSLRALYRVNDEWSVFGGISQAFRAPNLDDLTGEQTTKAGITTLGSLNVEPEEFMTYEIGARRISSDLSLAGSVFYTQINDLIVSIPSVAPPAPDNRLINGGEGYIYGLELEGVWDFAPQWSLRGFAAWQDGEIDEPAFVGGPTITENPSRLLPLTGSVALRWTSEDEKFWIQGRLMGATTEDRLSAAQQNADRQRIPTNGTPSYVAASVNAAYQLTDNLQVSASVENLLDEDYRIHGSGQNEPGITGILGLEMTW